MQTVDIAKYREALSANYIKKLGRVTQVVGLTIESAGPEVNLGAACAIKANKYSEPVLAEVVGFRQSNILLMPMGGMSGVGPGSIVEALGKPLSIKVS
ncbi:MAG: EscN/YscN/HrcN family type III secretion system ATPase, partial [Clostridiales bacterium]|nr:EscN/YscN/HrcN family type III secretion system ATPase [Clostridiales bacterium]